MESKLVDIGTHSLCLYSNRPFDSPSTGQPAVLFLSGLGCSYLGWTAVLRILGPTVHAYIYERAGYGSSQLSPLPPTAENIALELDLLIRNAEIKEPLLIVGHSWAGIFAPEYVLRAGNSNVAGLVLIDSNQEHTLEVTNWQDPDIVEIAQDVDYFTALGIRDEHKFTPEEFAVLMEHISTPQHILAFETEKLEYPQSLPTLGKKKIMEMDPPLLGDKPLCVIIGQSGRDMQRLTDAGMQRGNGTDAQRQRVKGLIATWNEKEEALQRGQLVYSTNSKVLMAHESGHRIELTQPEVIVEAVRWCLDEYSHIK